MPGIVFEKNQLMNEEQFIEAEPKWNTDNVDGQQKITLRTGVYHAVFFVWIYIIYFSSVQSVTFVHSDFPIITTLLVV